MERQTWSRVLFGLCLAVLATSAAQCGTAEHEGEQLDENAIADAAIALEPTIFPEATEEPTPTATATATATQTPEPAPVEIVLDDMRNDVLDYSSRQPASSWSPGLDLLNVRIVYNPKTELMELFVSTDAEDMQGLLDNPYWELIIIGDSNPEGTVPIPGRGYYGIGEWWAACWAEYDRLSYEFYIREGNDFVQQGETLNAEFINGMIHLVLPEKFPRPDDYLGIAVQDAFQFEYLEPDDYTDDMRILENDDLSMWTFRYKVYFE